MNYIDQLYETLKNDLQTKIDDGCINGLQTINGLTESSPLRVLLQCTAVTNLSIESKQSIEAALAADRPHLFSFYNVIGFVIYPSFIDEMEEMMNEKEHQNDYLVKRIVGKIVELSFHDKGQDHLDRAVRCFVKASN